MVSTATLRLLGGARGAWAPPGGGGAWAYCVVTRTACLYCVYIFNFELFFYCVHTVLLSGLSECKQEFVRPRWPYDMRPSVRAEKYMYVIVIR